MSRLNGKVVLVTGASSGIGASCAERLAQEGAMVWRADIQEPAALRNRSAGHADRFLVMNVADEDTIATGIATILAQTGRLDGVVHAAGISGHGAVHELDPDAFDRVLQVNLRGSVAVARHAVRPMLAQRSGSIVLVASVLGFHAQAGNAAYNITKGGVIMLAKTMAVDYGVAGIRVNALCPGLIETPMTSALQQHPQAYKQMVDWHALGRPGRPEEVAAAAAFLISDDASFITGHALVVDGGWSAGQRVILD